MLRGFLYSRRVAPTSSMPATMAAPRGEDGLHDVVYEPSKIAHNTEYTINNQGLVSSIAAA